MLSPYFCLAEAFSNRRWKIEPSFSTLTSSTRILFGETPAKLEWLGFFPRVLCRFFWDSSSPERLTTARCFSGIFFFCFLSGGLGIQRSKRWDNGKEGQRLVHWLHHENAFFFSPGTFSLIPLFRKEKAMVAVVVVAFYWLSVLNGEKKGKKPKRQE